tara:strand:+ start:5100 stop:5687 length:588 start_codon:yes stop_codon:yes gene_type:complete
MELFLSLLISLCFSADPSANFKTGDASFAQAEVDKLKDAVLNKKLQIRMFQEILESEGINQSYPKITIEFGNRLGGRYRIFSVEYIINGVRSYFYQTPDTEIRKVSSVKENVESYETTLAPGEHDIQVIVNYVGNDSGIFSYLSEYKVQMQQKKKLKFTKDNDYKILVQAYEKGGLLSDFKEKAKLSIAFQEISK